MPAEKVTHLARRRRTTRRAAAVYVRLDTHRGGAGVSAEQQEADCRALADAHRWDVVDVYADNDATAYARAQRPEYDRMVDDVRSGKIKAIAVWHVDRLVRRNQELEPLISLCDELDVDLATVTGEIDLATNGGRSFARQLGAFARHEADHRSEKLEARNRDRADAGQPWVSGTRCYGYDTDGLTVIPDEARVIRDVAKRIVAGESMRSICLQLNEAGHLTTRGRPWHATALRRLITNPRLVGKRVYKGKVTAGEWEPIITEALQEQVVAALDERTANTPGGRAVGTPRRYLLSGGLLICGLCGNALSAQPSGANKRGYVCRKDGGHGCGRIRIAADPIENEVAERVLARLASPSIRKRLAAAMEAGDDFGGDRILEKIASEEARLAELGVDYADRLIGRIEFMAARDRIQARVEDLRQSAAGAARIRQLPGLDPESLADWWENAASLPQRRDLVSLVLDHVVVAKATRFGPVGLDEGRLSWVWRTD